MNVHCGVASPKDYHVYSVLPVCMPAGQKRAPDLTIDGCEPPYGCWELNSGPLEEQSVFWTTEPSLQSSRAISNIVFSSSASLLSERNLSTQSRFVCVCLCVCVCVCLCLTLLYRRFHSSVPTVKEILAHFRENGKYIEQPLLKLGVCVSKEN